jgi:hypothetical protein
MKSESSSLHNAVPMSPNSDQKADERRGDRQQADEQHLPESRHVHGARPARGQMQAMTATIGTTSVEP